MYLSPLVSCHTLIHIHTYIYVCVHVFVTNRFLSHIQNHFQPISILREHLITLYILFDHEWQTNKDLNQDKETKTPPEIHQR